MSNKLNPASAAGAVLSVGLLLAGPAFGQENVTVEVQTSAQSQAQIAAGPIEEVIVTGQRSIGALIREAGDLTEDFYARLNFVLDNEDYEITCQNEFPTGSRISTRVCRTRFEEELMARQSASMLRTIGSNEDDQLTQFGTADMVAADMRLMRQQFEEDVLVAVNNDQLLNDQVIRLIALKSSIDNYQSPREQRRADREADEAFEESLNDD
jgi:hypothetical protein